MMNLMNLMTLLNVLYIPFFLGCLDSTPFLQQVSESTGVDDTTIASLEAELNDAYRLWEQEEYETAFEALQSMNQNSLKNVWPVMRAADPESTLRLEVQFGKVLWATEHKRSYEGQDAPRTLRAVLLRELNDVRHVEEIPPDQPAATTP